MGPTQVVITSFHVPAASFHLPAAVTAAASATDGQEPPEELLVLSSERVGSGATATYQRYLYTVPRLPGYFAGTGDLTAALLLVFSQRTHSLLRATQITYVFIHVVLICAHAQRMCYASARLPVDAVRVFWSAVCAQIIGLAGRHASDACQRGQGVVSHPISQGLVRPTYDCCHSYLCDRSRWGAVVCGVGLSCVAQAGRSPGSWP